MTICCGVGRVKFLLGVRTQTGTQRITDTSAVKSEEEDLSVKRRVSMEPAV